MKNIIPTLTVENYLSKKLLTPIMSYLHNLRNCMHNTLSYVINTMNYAINMMNY